MWKDWESTIPIRLFFCRNCETNFFFTFHIMRGLVPTLVPTKNLTSETPGSYMKPAYEIRIHYRGSFNNVFVVFQFILLLFNRLCWNCEQNYLSYFGFPSCFRFGKGNRVSCTNYKNEKKDWLETRRWLRRGCLTNISWYSKAKS